MVEAPDLKKKKKKKKKTRRKEDAYLSHLESRSMLMNKELTIIFFMISEHRNSGCIDFCTNCSSCMKKKNYLFYLLRIEASRSLSETGNCTGFC
jgi:hypothetical protein